ncbi:hypothetical protein CDAR_17101 [Caerostris darwini]|uniref:Uncharacterized protein n=1 Tax=Caerostris darwini TaxID=1538125 RepID=A0AAV4WYP3_9ARAC|nr:hypothetical protein CDAR_17101 [Caerostris darwini]
MKLPSDYCGLPDVHPAGHQRQVVMITMTGHIGPGKWQEFNIDSTFGHGGAGIEPDTHKKIDWKRLPVHPASGLCSPYFRSAVNLTNILDSAIHQKVIV